MRIRKRIDRLDDGERDRLRSAFAALIESDDPSGNYAFWASIHRFCPHRTGLFLPWHRAYIFAFENALRAVPGCAEVTLPFWDWTVLREIPPLVTEYPLTSDRFPNPDPSMLPTAAEVQGTLTEPDFLRFGGAGCSVIGRAGSLENYHGEVHTWVGPIMADPRTASQDPIFWFHHSFVDRVWTLWQSQYTGVPCPHAPETILQGIPGAPTVGDVLAATTLGYSYAEAADHLTGPVRMPANEPLVVLVPDVFAGATIVLTLDGVAFDDSGDPPAAFDLVVERGTPRAGVISLFGARHDGHDASAPECKHTGGAPAAVIRLPSPLGRQPLSVALVPRWSAAARSRAGVSIESIRMQAI